MTVTATLILPITTAPAISLAPYCVAGSTFASCNLTSVLHTLYVIAAALAIILIVVVAFAAHAWRKTKEADLTRQ